MPHLNTSAKLFIACVMCVLSSIASAVTPMIQADRGALVIKADASLWVVGPVCNDQAECPFTSPVRATNLAGAQSIAIAGGASFVVKQDGTVWAWGNNVVGVLGVGLAPSFNQFPLQPVTALSQIQTVHCQVQHCLALGRDGRVWSWGINSLGQVGDGTTIDRWIPVLVNGLPVITQVWASPSRSLALAADGSIWNWGSGLGQVPAPYGGAPNLISNVIAVAGYANGDIFLKSDGSVWARGGNEFGQRGNGSVSVPGNTFTRVNNLSDIIAIRANANRYMALKRDGTVWSWGSNIDGAIGAGSFTQAVYDQPVMLALQDIVAIEVGNAGSYAIAADGTIYSWGNNDLGSLGDNGVSNRASPVRMIGPGGSGFFNVNLNQAPTNRLPTASFSATPTQGNTPMLVTVDASPSTDADGTIVSYQWFSSDGQTRSGKQATFTFNSGGSYVIRLLVTDNSGATAVAYPTQVVATAPSVTINTPPMLAAGVSTTAALRNDGKAFSWGARNSLGRQEPAAQGSFPKLIDNLSGILQISMGGEHGLAVLADGALAAWGFNTYGQLGDGTTILGRQIPVTVVGVSSMVAASAGWTHSLALKSDGTVYAWGTNQFGQFGTGAFVDSFVPVQVLGISNVAAIATPQHSSVALKRDGTVWAWGSNTRGELGLGTRAVTPSPTQIAGLSGISKIWCQLNNCFARGTNGSTWAWGAGDAGSLGAGIATGDALSPIRVTPLDGYTDFALAGKAALGLKADGTVWAWGDNQLGQLGQGFTSTASQLLPIRVPNITGAIRVAFGGQGTGYALRADGTVRSWGSNIFGTAGMIGDGTLAQRLTPVSVTNSTLDGPLDLLPDIPNDADASLDPLFYVQTASAGDLSALKVVVDTTVRARPVDLGTTQSTYVFALAPACLVKGAQLKGGAGIDDPAYHINLKATPAPGVVVDPKDGPLGCVLAQLNSAGQLTAVSASNLQAYVTGVLSAGGTAVNVLNNISAAAIQGSTFYVGYGATGTSMINNGVNRSVVTVPGTQTCQPQAPQTGWWWDPTQRDRGYGIEVRGNNLFYASFVNNPSGVPSWTVASGPTALDGSLFQASLYSYTNGQTLTGALKPPTGPNSEGLITISTATATQGTMIAPVGTRGITRMEFMPSGLSTTPQTNQPENGWWWNTAEPGRGYFIEWQNGYASVTGYMYDEAGKPIWYQSMAPTTDPRIFNGTLSIFGGGYPLTQSGSSINRKMARLTDNFQALSIRFSDASNGTLTLPGGRAIPITRLRF